jgi:hypothetical protein
MNNQTSRLNDDEHVDAGELTIDKLDAVNGGALSDLANKHYEMLKSIVNNLRG